MKGNFLELLYFPANHNEKIDKFLKNVHGNFTLVTLSIQKDIVNVAGCETIKILIDDVRHDCFVILIDGSYVR